MLKTSQIHPGSKRALPCRAGSVSWHSPFTPYWSSTSGRQRKSQLASAKVSLLLSQGKLHWWRVNGGAAPLHPPINAELEAGQGSSTVFQAFGVARLGIEPKLRTLMARAQPTAVPHSPCHVHFRKFICKDRLMPYGFIAEISAKRTVKSGNSN